MTDYKNVLVKKETTIRDVMRVIDNGAQRIALVCDENNYLLGVVADGDIRRALLVDSNMEDSIERIMTTDPIVATHVDSRSQRLRIMDEHDLLALPVVDRDGFLIGLETLRSAIHVSKLDNPVFIMAGGFGTRLRPLTDNCPKPMLKVGDKPMLHHLVQRFSELGFHNIYISTHYLPEQIQKYFGDGSRFGVNINYIHEETPLGTGGALGLLPDDIPRLPLIMMNGDVMTNMDFSQLLKEHEKEGYDATMCVKELEHQVPFGVINSDNNLITGMKEKPIFRYNINTGIYILSPDCVKSVEKNSKIDLPSLLEQRMNEGVKIGMYLNHDYWLDVGRMSDYEKAQNDVKNIY